MKNNKNSCASKAPLCQEVAALGRDSAGRFSASSAARGVEAALPPQLPPSLTPPPLPLLLPCTSSSLPAAVRSAYRGLGVLVGGEATPVVVLCEEDDSKEVMAALVEEGAPVQGYYTTGDRQGLEAFLTNPRGVLCTHQDSFSGLECRLLLWIAGYFGGRSSILRAVETVAIVDPYGRVAGLPPGSCRVDAAHAQCSKRIGSYTCSSCTVPVCGDCASACHHQCSTGDGRTALKYKPGSKGCECAKSHRCVLTV